MITEKNKEEIEKIEEKLEEILKNYHPSYSNLTIKGMLKQATINTSIQWCEDEIEFLKEFYEFYDLSKEHVITIRLKQLQNHLTWLKQQEKNLK